MGTTTLTPSQRSQRARVGALALHATGGTTVRAAVEGRFARFRAQVVAAAAARGETLTPEEIERRALFARRADMARLALRSSVVRTKRAIPAGGSPGMATSREGTVNARRSTS